MTRKQATKRRRTPLVDRRRVREARRKEKALLHFTVDAPDREYTDLQELEQLEEQAERLRQRIEARKKQAAQVAG